MAISRAERLTQRPEPSAEAWSPDPAGFLADLEAKPVAVSRLANDVDQQVIARAVAAGVRRVVFLGMGSSRYAAEVAAIRLRAAGFDAVSEYGSARAATPAAADVLAVAISASGNSPETSRAMFRHVGISRTLVITNETSSALAKAADMMLPMLAGPEAGGVACRSFQHTGLLLRMLEAGLTGVRLDHRRLFQRVAAATQDLLDRRPVWLPEVASALDGPDGVYVLAPVERCSSADQSALMFREGPRRAADACETGDWNHVDVYLAKTLDYRALLLTGSPSDAEAMAWLHTRGSTVVAVGGPASGAEVEVRYRHDDDEEVAVHVETLVAELVAATWWSNAIQAVPPS